MEGMRVAVDAARRTCWNLLTARRVPEREWQTTRVRNDWTNLDSTNDLLDESGRVP